MTRRCKCGLHWRHDPPYPKRVSVTLNTEVICVTKPTDDHVQKELGRQYGLISVRVPFWMMFYWVKAVPRRAHA